MLFAVVAVGLTVGLIWWEWSSLSGNVQPTIPPSPWQLWALVVWVLAGFASYYIHRRIQFVAVGALDDRLTLERLQEAEADAASAGGGGGPGSARRIDSLLRPQD